MTIKEIHDFIVFILNKEATGYVSHVDIDKAIDRAQLSKFNELYSNPKMHQPGRAIPPIAYGQTQKIVDDLRFFKRREQFNSNASGVIDLTGLTGSYLHLLSVSVSKTLNNTTSNSYSVSDLFISFSKGTANRNVTKNVKIVSEDQLADRLVSQVAAPSVTSPIGILGDSGDKIQLFPEVSHSGFIMYLERPRKPLFSHVIDGRKVVHNSSTSSTASFTAQNALTLADGTTVASGATYTLPASIDLNWPEDCINDIINRSLTSFGIHLEDVNVYNYTEVKNKEGL
jgi:hypothetical protein